MTSLSRDDAAMAVQISLSTQRRAGVVPAEAALRGAHDALRLFGPQAHVSGAERHHEVLADGALAIGDGLIDDQAHPQVALHPRGELRVGGIDAVAGPPHVGHEIGEHDLLHAGLAQRRQHTLDVAQEHPVRTDDQHALVLQREPVRVEQIGGAVQRHDGLAGAGTALHHQHTGLWRTDDLVLLALDGGDDVAQLTGAATLQDRQQRAVATDALGGGDALAVVLGADAEVALAEQLVLDAQQLATLHVEVTAAHQTQRFAAGGTVERLGHGGPPVDHHRIGVLVGHGEATDVEALELATVISVLNGRRFVERPVDATEHQGHVAQVELGETIEHGLIEHIAFVSGLERAAERALVEATHLPGIDLALLEAVVGVVDERLLSGEIGVMLRHENWGPHSEEDPKIRFRNSIGGRTVANRQKLNRQR